MSFFRKVKKGTLSEVLVRESCCDNCFEVRGMFRVFDSPVSISETLVRSQRPKHNPPCTPHHKHKLRVGMYCDTISGHNRSISCRDPEVKVEKRVF